MQPVTPSRPVVEAEATDEALNEAYERHLRGVEPLRLAYASRDNGASGGLFESNPWDRDDPFPIRAADVTEHCAKFPAWKVCYRTVTRANYCASIETVLPQLNRDGPWKVEFREDGYRVTVERPAFASERAAALGRAAVLALLRAHNLLRPTPAATAQSNPV